MKSYRYGNDTLTIIFGINNNNHNNNNNNNEWCCFCHNRKISPQHSNLCQTCIEDMDRLVREIKQWRNRH
jgi:hypothetical protein